MASKATLTTVASSGTEVALFSANPDRNGLLITNASTAIMYVRLLTGGETTAATTTTGHSLQIPSLGTVDLGAWRGAARAIWASANGSAQITSLE
jgi:hypothetical protein